VTTTVQWKTITFLTRTVTKAADLSPLLFRARASPGLYTDLSASLAYAYVPLWLDLQPTYFQTIIKELQAHGVGVRGTKFPLAVDLPGLGIAPITMTARLYPPNLLVLTFRARPNLALNDPERLNHLIETLMQLRLLNSIAPLARIGRLTAGLLEANSHRDYKSNVNLRSYVTFELADALPQKDARGYINAHQRHLVALLIGNPSYHEMSEDITNRIMEKNADFNKKTTKEYLLINKQSVLYLTAQGYRRGPHGHRLGRTLDLYELAVVTAHFLDNYLSIRRKAQNFVDYVLTRMQAWIRSPEALLSSSATSTYVWKLLMEEFQLSRKLELLKSSNPRLLHRLEERAELFQELSGRWWKEAAYADAFDEDPDQAGDFDLSLIQDPSDRALLRRDYHEAVSSLSAQNYKATVVLCGSLAEALLRVWLQRHNYVTAQELDAGRLYDYLATARNHPADGFIKDASILTMVDDGLRQWRNLVHPAVAQRRNMLVDEHKAAICVELVKSLAKNLI
jgi:hypothetical protein